MLRRCSSFFLRILLRCLHIASSTTRSFSSCAVSNGQAISTKTEPLSEFPFALDDPNDVPVQIQVHASLVGSSSSEENSTAASSSETILRLSNEELSGEILISDKRLFWSLVQDGPTKVLVFCDAPEIVDLDGDLLLLADNHKLKFLAEFHRLLYSHLQYLMQQVNSAQQSLVQLYQDEDATAAVTSHYPSSESVGTLLVRVRCS